VNHRWMAHLFHLTIYLFTEHHCHIQGTQRASVNILPNRDSKKFRIFDLVNKLLLAFYDPTI